MKNEAGTFKKISVETVVRQQTAKLMSDQWHYNRGGKQVGPVSGTDLKELAASGQLSPTDMVWKDGMGAWAPASSLKGLFNSNPTPLPVPANPFAGLDARRADFQDSEPAGKKGNMKIPGLIISFIGCGLTVLGGLIVGLAGESKTDPISQFLVGAGTSFIGTGIGIAGIALLGFGRK